MKSILPKLDEIRTLSRETKTAVIAITETWLDDCVNDSEIKIAGYCSIRADRNRSGEECAYLSEMTLHSSPGRTYPVLMLKLHG